MTEEHAEIVVVGAGVCGTFAVRAARAAGAQVVHVAAPTPPHSMAASAIAKPTYLPAHRRAELAGTLAAYGDAVTRAGAWVSTYRKPGLPLQHVGECWLIDPEQPLRAWKPDVEGIVEAAKDRTVWLEDGSKIRAKAIILATGAGSTLSPGGGTTTWGVTWRGPVGLLERPEDLRLHMWAPYKTISAGPVGEHCRVGSSTALTPAMALDRGEQLIEIAHRVGLVRSTNGFEAVMGARYKTERHVQPVAPGIFWVGGHHRNGYALGPADAARCAALAVQEARR